MALEAKIEMIHTLSNYLSSALIYIKQVLAMVYGKIIGIFHTQRVSNLGIRRFF